VSFPSAGSAEFWDAYYRLPGTSAGVSAQNVACGRQTRFIPRLISRKSAAKTGQFVSGITTGRWENLWKALSVALVEEDDHGLHGWSGIAKPQPEIIHRLRRFPQITEADCYGPDFPIC